MTQQLQSIIESADARPAGLRLVEPLKITSCIDSPRSSEAFDSPSTQRTASMMFDLPQPFGPTTPTSCPGTWKLVGSTKDLKPESLMEVNRTSFPAKKEKPGGMPGGDDQSRAIISSGWGLSESCRGLRVPFVRPGFPQV